MATGQYAEAAVQYRNARALDPGSGAVRVRLAEAFLRGGNFGDALGEYVRAADLLPDDLALQLHTGNLLLLAGRFDDARARAEKVLEENAGDLNAQILVANALAGLKHFDAAVIQIEEAIKIAQDRSGTYSNLGALELSRGRRDAAEEAFKKAVELQPTSVQARVALGIFYWLTDQVAAAELALTQALDLEPRSALMNRVLADFYVATNRLSLAEQHLKTVWQVTGTSESAFALAEYYVALGREADGRAILEPMSSDPRTSAVANVRLAAIDYRGGRHDEAYRRLAGVLEKDQTNLQALLLKSGLLLADERTDEALASANAAAERHPASASALFALGRAQMARRQPAAAIAAYREVLRLNPRATAAKVALGQLELMQGRADVSVALAGEALATEPGNGDAHLLYVRGLLTKGELDRAEADLKQLMTRFPDSAAVHTQMGMLLGRKRQIPAARTEFERALKIQPDDGEALAGLTVLDLAAKDYAGARARIDARIAANPTAALLTLAARTYAAGGDLVGTERMLRKAIDLDGDYVTAYGALGQLYLAQGKLASARAEFEALAGRSPHPGSALTMVGIIQQIEGDVEGARDRFEQVLRIDPEAAVAANNLAWIYAEHGGNLDVALHLAQTAQKRLPGIAQVNHTLGYIYYKKDLVSLAIRTFKLSAENDPGNPLYQYHLGLAYAKAGETTNARQSLVPGARGKVGLRGCARSTDLLRSLELH